MRELAFNDRKALDAMRITEAEYKYTLIKTKLFNAKHQFDVLKGVLQLLSHSQKLVKLMLRLHLMNLIKRNSNHLQSKKDIAKRLKRLGLEQKDKTQGIGNAFKAV